MLIPNEELIATGGENNQLNTQQAPAEQMNISDAGRAFLQSLTPDASAAPSGENAPESEGNAILNSETPVTEEVPATADTSTLEAIRDSILSEIQSLAKSTDVQAKDETDPWDTVGDDETEEESDSIDITDDDFMEAFSQNPVQAVTDLANKLADQKVKAEMASLTDKMKPLLDKSEELAFDQKVADVVAEFTDNEEYADAEKYYSKMAEIIKEKGLPKDDINSFISAYKDAALEDARAGQGKSLDDYMSDENTISQITSNPKIQEAVIRNYLQQLSQGGKPQVISSGGSVQPAATPSTDIKTFEEAKKAFKQQL